MACTHERIKSVNCVLFCDICGVKLPADFLTGKNPHNAENAAETPVESQESPKEAPKSTRKRTTTKKGAK